MTVQQGSPHRRRTRPLWLYAVVGAFLLLALAVGVPAWASSTPTDLQQGTVPPPPPDDSGEEEEEENSPSATATPVPAGQAPPVAAPTPAGTPSSYTGVVNAPRLNVRSGPGVTFDVLGRVFEGESLQILFRNPEGDWWYVCCIAGTTTSGWVSAAFIAPDFDATQALALIPVSDSEDGTPVTTTPAVQGSPGITDATVSAFRLNVRSEPTISGTILGKLEDGTVVTVIARNQAGDWWYICCVPAAESVQLTGTATGTVAGTVTGPAASTVTGTVPSSGIEGWAAARFLAPGFPRTAANRLIPVFGQTGTVLPTPTPRPNAAATPAASLPTTATEISVVSSLTETETAEGAGPTVLEVGVSQAPTLAVQGAPLELRFAISNTGDVTATAVELRNELPAGLVLGIGAASGGARYTSARTPEGAEIFAFLWPEIAPSEVITASVLVTVSATLTDGVVIESLAAVSAANAPAQTAVVNIGLPPAALPDFR